MLFAKPAKLNQPIDLGRTLAQVLADNQGHAAFKRLMEKNMAGEGLAFLDAMSGEKVGIDQVMKEFILEDAPHMINLSSETRRKLIDICKAQEENEALNRAVLETLKVAVDEVFADVKKSESFNLFLRSRDARGLIVLSYKHLTLSAELCCWFFFFFCCLLVGEIYFSVVMTERTHLTFSENNRVAVQLFSRWLKVQREQNKSSRI